jgi:hypothetical protein
MQLAGEKRVCLSILAFAKPDGGGGLVPPQSRHPSPESTLISGINHFSERAAKMVAIGKQFRNQVQVWPDTGEAGAMSLI